MLKHNLKQAELDFKYPFAYKFESGTQIFLTFLEFWQRSTLRRGLDPTVEAALRITAGYTPKQSRPRFVLRPKKNQTSSLQVRVEGIRHGTTTSARILGQTVASSAFSCSCFKWQL